MMISVPLAFMISAPGPGELVVLFLAVLILFGPRRLPEIARTIGKVFSQLRRASQDFRDQVMRIDETPRAPEKPAPDPDEYAAAAEASEKTEHGVKELTDGKPDDSAASTGKDRHDLAG